MDNVFKKIDIHSLNRRVYVSVEKIKENVESFTKEYFLKCEHKELANMINSHISHLDNYVYICNDNTQVCKASIASIPILSYMNPSEQECLKCFVKDFTNEFHGVKYANYMISRVECEHTENEFSIWAILNKQICREICSNIELGNLNVEENSADSLNPIIPSDNHDDVASQSPDDLMMMVETPENNLPSMDTQKELLDACKSGSSEVTENEIELLSKMCSKVKDEHGYNITWNLLRKNITRLSNGALQATFVKPKECKDHILLGYSKEKDKIERIITCNVDGIIEEWIVEDSEITGRKNVYSDLAEFFKKGLKHTQEDDKILTESADSDGVLCPFKVVELTLQHNLPLLEDILEGFDNPSKKNTLHTSTSSKIYNFDVISKRIETVIDGLVSLVKSNPLHESLKDTFGVNQAYSNLMNSCRAEFYGDGFVLANVPDHGIYMSNFIETLGNAKNNLKVESMKALQNNLTLEGVTREYLIAFTKIFCDLWSENVKTIHSMVSYDVNVNQDVERVMLV